MKEASHKDHVHIVCLHLHEMSTESTGQWLPGAEGWGMVRLRRNGKFLLRSMEYDKYDKNVLKLIVGMAAPLCEYTL